MNTNCGPGPGAGAGGQGQGRRSSKGPGAGKYKHPWEQLPPSIKDKSQNISSINKKAISSSA